MDEAQGDTRSDESLLKMLTETFRELVAFKLGNRHNGGVGTEGEVHRSGGDETWRRSEGRMLRPTEDDKEDEGRANTDDEQVKERKRTVLRVLRELSMLHSDRVTAWRQVLRESVCMLNYESPPGGSDQQQLSEPESEVTPCSDSFSDTFRHVEEDAREITDKLSTIVTRLDREILQLSAGEALAVEAAHQETGDPEASEESEDSNSRTNANDHLESGYNVEDGADKSHTGLLENTEQTSDFISSSSECNNVEDTGKELEVKGQVNHKEDCVSVEKHSLEETDTREVNDNCKEEIKSEWVSVGLAGKVEDSQSHSCLVRASTGAAEALRCEAADDFSFLVVTGSEELLSTVIRVKVREGSTVRFPVTVAVPFNARYRSTYRDVAVKIVDEARRAGYVTPLITEGTYGGQRGTFAEVKVYSLGLFAVVSCLKRDNYTVSRKGLSLKLSSDPRISLSYLPGSFTAPVMAQVMVQPVDATLLAAVKSRSDAHHSVVSTSPVLHLTHPASQPLRRPLAVTLPCPPNTEKKRETRGQKEEMEHRHSVSVRSAPQQDQPAPDRLRLLKKETSSELLIVLGSSDKQWSVLEKVHVRNQQNGLVAFELTENIDRLLVVRLLSQVQPCHLASLAEELEESVCSHSVNIVLQQRKDEPHAVLVAALPSRDLGWERNKLRAQGYGGLLETSSEISMCEGDQLLLRFCGNVASTGLRNGQNLEHITFHSQRRNHLLVHLCEVDPFGNYSSPHYKGTVVFHKVTRGQLAWQSDEAVPIDATLLGDPVCKLSLTLPKRARNSNRPVTARVTLCEDTDSLSDSLLLWLSAELSEEDVALLAPSLRLRRSTAQLVKLRAGDDVATQAFHVLAMWRRGLPAAPHLPKASHLAQCLSRSGRPDLARELLLRQAAATRQSSLKKES